MVRVQKNDWLPCGDQSIRGRWRERHQKSGQFRRLSQFFQTGTQCFDITSLFCVVIGLVSLHSVTVCLFFNTGAGWGARFTYFHHAASRTCAPPGGTDPGRPVRERYLSVRQRLFHPAPPPKDHRRSSCYHCLHHHFWANGEGEAQIYKYLLDMLPSAVHML